MSGAIEVIDKGILVAGDPDQYTAWTKAADGAPLAEWLIELADEAAHAKLERVWPFVLELKHPIDFAGERITSLKFRRGKMGDAKGIKIKAELASEDIMLIASRMCAQPVAALALLDVEDGGEVTTIAMDFFVKFLTSGRTR